MASHLLTDAALRRAKPADKRQRLNDGDGLYLLLLPDGKRWWRFDYRWHGRDKTLSLGVYPDVSLSRARARADEIRQQLLDGIDPSAARKAAKVAGAAPEGTPPDAFENVAREWLARVHALKVSPGHAERTRLRLEQNVFPWLGQRPISSIKPPELLACLRRVADRGALETAHRVKQAAGQVFRYGVPPAKPLHPA